MRFLFRSAALLGAAVLAGCAAPSATTFSQPAAVAPRSAAWTGQLAALLPTEVLLIGEQHDAPAHQQLQREAVQWLAARGQLAALVMEMAEAGHTTAGLPRDASEAQVQAALAWRDAAWPWASYGPVAMAAVRAGVPVLGGNLPRAGMQEAMRDPRWDGHLPAQALQEQYQALRDGHCGLLPPSQIPGMARIQIARDASMARVAADARLPGRVVVLVAGGGHVLRHLGVPTHWPAGLQSKVVLAQSGKWPAAIESGADLVFGTPALPPRDHCADLRGGPAKPAAAPPAAAPVSPPPAAAPAAAPAPAAAR